MEAYPWKNVDFTIPLDIVQVMPVVGDCNSAAFSCRACNLIGLDVIYDVSVEWGDTKVYENMDMCGECARKLLPLSRNANHLSLEQATRPRQRRILDFRVCDLGLMIDKVHVVLVRGYETDVTEDEFRDVCLLVYQMLSVNMEDNVLFFYADRDDEKPVHLGHMAHSCGERLEISKELARALAESSNAVPHFPIEVIHGDGKAFKTSNPMPVHRCKDYNPFLCLDDNRWEAMTVVNFTF